MALLHNHTHALLGSGEWKNQWLSKAVLVQDTSTVRKIMSWLNADPVHSDGSWNFKKLWHEREKNLLHLFSQTHPVGTQPFFWKRLKIFFIHSIHLRRKQIWGRELKWDVVSEASLPQAAKTAASLTASVFRVSTVQRWSWAGSTHEFMPCVDAPHLWDRCERTMPCQSTQITMVMKHCTKGRLKCHL